MCILGASKSRLRPGPLKPQGRHCIYIYISCVYYFKESFNDLHNIFKNYMRDSTVNARKLNYIVVEVSTCHFRAMLAQNAGSAM